MKRLLTWIGRRRYPYEPLISVTVSRSRLLGNLAEFRRSVPGSLIAPVLKSNAYGHGLFEVAAILEKADRRSRPDEAIPFYCVDSYFEAVALRRHRFKAPLLVIGYTRPETITESRLKKTSFTVTSLETLRTIADVDHPVSIQLKFDTGMHRQGIMPEEATTAIDMLRKSQFLYLEGLCTHFADADNDDAAFTRGQIAAWDEVVKQFKLAFDEIPYIHAAATDGSRYSDQLRSGVVRLGIGLYGLSDTAAINRKLKLQPVLEMHTILTGVKKLSTGQSVGYGATFTAEQDMTIATIPVGYYEGLDRRLSNKGSIQVGPDRISCPILGRVSMNITVIDVSALAEATIGTEAVVISSEAADPNSIRSMAAACGTITYEHVVHIPGHLKRVVTV